MTHNINPLNMRNSGTLCLKSRRGLASVISRALNMLNLNEDTFVEGAVELVSSGLTFFFSAPSKTFKI